MVVPAEGTWRIHCWRAGRLKHTDPVGCAAGEEQPALAAHGLSPCQLQDRRACSLCVVLLLALHHQPCAEASCLSKPHVGNSQAAVKVRASLWEIHVAAASGMAARVREGLQTLRNQGLSEARDSIDELTTCHSWDGVID